VVPFGRTKGTMTADQESHRAEIEGWRAGLLMSRSYKMAQ
jgi:hypothetical protein